MAFNVTPICRKCKGEQLRYATPRGYHYFCDCETWKAQLRFLGQIREKEKRRRR